MHFFHLTRATLLARLIIIDLIILTIFGYVAVAEPSKAWVCGRSLAGIAGSKPAGGMDVCLL
jgi:hypothetical protein